MKPASKPENGKIIPSSFLTAIANPASVAPKAILNVKALTWLRDSHGLFDYESFQLTKNTLKIESTCTIARCGTDVRVLSEAEVLQADSPTNLEKVEKLATIQFLNGISRTQYSWIIIGKYYVESCSQKTIYDSQSDKLWLIVKCQQNQPIKRIPHEVNNVQEILLRRGDVLKLGRVAFRVRDFRIEGVSDCCGRYEGPYQDDHIDFQPSKFIPTYFY